MTSIETQAGTSPVTQVKAPKVGLSSWPRVIGVISVVYALGGLLCQVGIGFMGTFGDTFINLAGGQAELPLVAKIISGSLMLIGLGVGIYMLVGAIALLRRLRSGVSILRNWAVVRMVLVVLACLAAIVNVPTSITFQKAVIEMQNNQFIEAEMLDRVKPIPNDNELHRQMMVQAGIFAGLVSIYPIFIGFYCTRRKVTEDVETWI